MMLQKERKKEKGLINCVHSTKRWNALNFRKNNKLFLKKIGNEGVSELQTL